MGGGVHRVVADGIATRALIANGIATWAPTARLLGACDALCDSWPSQSAELAPFESFWERCEMSVREVYTWHDRQAVEDVLR